ncbi:FAD:protein FMN transferase [Companilactobacillus jidongensis]|uniref:FAD:protein FMN transferase n=1 Tax=Companilactobacillus jidongensis TaxID=2486006 RepID=UPI000F784F85|nr:FAD:protein FMN transferase [Companilactobacillus jidongensis]
MTEAKYYFPNRVIQMMNVPFTVKLAVTEDDEVVQTILNDITEKVTDKLRQMDDDFSPFKNDSMVTRFQNGDEAPLIDSDEFQAVYAQTVIAEQMTHHYFNATFAGKYDPTGLVKGWAIEQAFEKYLRPLLMDAKIVGISLNGGGDMKLAVKQGCDFNWGIGIENPNDTQQILTTYYIQDGAIATSGNSKRGEHILRSNNSEIEQVTIISSSLVDADVWATAGISAGTEEMATLITESNLTGMMVDKKLGSIDFRNGVIKNAQKTSL